MDNESGTSAQSAPAAADARCTDAQKNQIDDRYEHEIDLDSDSTHARVVRLVGHDRHVLELGPATGYMTRVLRDRGCTVVGIELESEMAKVAAQYCERIVIGDLDELDLDAELGADRFDVIAAADVLEHLKDPLSVLRRLRKFLKPGGHFVVSLPNVAHGSVRIALLQGHFNYQNVGLLDTTHLRFFTRESIGELFDSAELAVAQIFHQPLNIEASEVPFDAGDVPPEVLEELARDPEARTYQFVIKAVPLDAPGLRELQHHLRELAHENAEVREANAELREENAELREATTGTLATVAGREDELRSALIRAHDQTLRRDGEIQQLQEALKSAMAAEETAKRLRVRLERITNSPPARAYAMLSTFPGLKRVRAARAAGYERAYRRAHGSDSSDS